MSVRSATGYSTKRTDVGDSGAARMPPFRQELSLDVLEIAKSVIARRSEAVFVPFRSVGMSEDGKPDWRPRPKYCHDNVAAWVYRSPLDKHARGYVICDLRAIIGVWQVQAHSVVELEDGTLIDITPSGASQLYPFVRHVGSEEEFAEMACAMRVNVPASFQFQKV
jgi:hypothetical protein